MTIRTANHHTPGVHIFYVHSDSGSDYVVQHIRRTGQHRWFCDCPDFQFRRLACKRHCKHARLLARMARGAHGVSKIRSQEITAPAPPLIADLEARLRASIVAVKRRRYVESPEFKQHELAHENFLMHCSGCDEF